MISCEFCKKIKQIIQRKGSFDKKSETSHGQPGCIHTGPFNAYFSYQTDHNCHFLCDNLFPQCEQPFLKLSLRPLKPL